MRLPELFEVYPDARIIMTHRHPVELVPSTASLISSVRSLYSDNESPERTGEEQAKVWSLYFNRSLDAIKKLKKHDQIIHIRFEDFVSNQVETAKNIYSQFNWELSTDVLEKFSHFLTENPKDNHGRHTYSLANFSLKEEEINKLYANYIDFLNELYSSPSYGA